MRVDIPCPHCQTSCTGRHSAQLTRLTKEVKCICQNPDCGHTFKIFIEAVLTLSPSAMPHPEINLPHSKRTQKSVKEKPQQTA